MMNYDDYLLEQADKHSGCLPEVIGYDDIYEFTDDDGRIVTTRDYFYSCHECDEKDCSYWSRYNEG